MALASLCAGFGRVASADEETPSRLGSDAPHQERTSSDKPGAFALRIASFGGTSSSGSAPETVRRRKQVRAVKTKAEGPAPAPIGTDAPHSERNSRPDLYAMRLLVWDR